MLYHTLYCQKFGIMSQNLSSAAVVIGALRVNKSPALILICVVSSTHNTGLKGQISKSPAQLKL